MKIHNHLFTKGETLIYLKDKLSTCIIPKTIIIKVSEFFKDKEAYLEKIRTNFPSKIDMLAVRSSAQDEDKKEQSQAGLYNSILNVKNSNKSICKAIDAVIDSYLKSGKIKDVSEEQIIIQKMVRNVSTAGVLFTRDIKYGAPYYVINYDDVTGRTDTITSGIGSTSNKALYVFKDSIDKVKSSRFIKLLNTAKEIEKTLKNKSLDIEFAIDNLENIYLLQVRPIAVSKLTDNTSDKQFSEHLIGLYSEVSNCFDRLQDLYGHKVIFGQMPDWNPVEIIGKQPSKLASSIYSYLITDNIWAKAREEMGYKSQTRTPLMHIFSGQPFINVAASFYSFLPANLNPDIGTKLVESFLNLLRLKPSYHDKVEFEVAITCFTLDFEEKIKRYENLKLSKDEKKHYKQKLISHTRKMISLNALKASHAKIEALQEKWDCLDEKSLNISDVPKLMDLCAHEGTKEFSILARHAFVATSILKSLVSIGVISPSQLETFKSSINSVASEFIDDLNKFYTKKIKYDILMQKYGHLRPGTYNIESPRYDQMDKLSKINSNVLDIRSDVFKFKPAELLSIEKAFREYGLKGIKAEIFIEYASNAIKMRESSKFVFSKILSRILEIVADYAQSLNMGRKDISFFSIKEIISFSEKAIFSGKRSELVREAKKRKKFRQIENCVTLPLLLFDAENVVIAPFFTNQPNFITNKIVSGEVKYIKEFKEDADLTGKIVLIESADPGYDWIFSYKIKGLITKFGGVNSHMSIRCAEFQIPSAIGCGSILFDDLLSSLMVRLDCTTCQLIKLR